jgi:hypothetical protein
LEQFAAAGTSRRHPQSPCPLTPEIPLRLRRDLRARLLPVFNRRPDNAFEDGFRPLRQTLKNRRRIRSVIPELLPIAEMARTEGTVDTVELKRNQSYFQALFRMRVPKRKEHHAKLRSGTLRSTKSGHWEQFAAAGTNRRHQQSPCPLTPTVPSVRAISAFGNRSGKLYGPIWPGFRVGPALGLARL